MLFPNANHVSGHRVLSTENTEYGVCILFQHQSRPGHRIPNTEYVLHPMFNVVLDPENRNTFYVYSQGGEGSNGASSFPLLCGAALRVAERFPGAHPRVRCSGQREAGGLGGSTGYHTATIMLSFTSRRFRFGVYRGGVLLGWEWWLGNSFFFFNTSTDG